MQEVGTSVVENKVMIITTSVDPSTSTDAELQELCLVRQDVDDDDAGCPFR